MSARAACFLLLVLPLSACVGPAAQADQTARSIDPALKASIYEYLDTEDAERADQLLAEILGRQDATPAGVAATLAAGRSYRPEPVRVLPSRALRLGAPLLYYRLYVPGPHRPSNASPRPHRLPGP